MDINPSILRDYDIRGITETEHSPGLIQEYEKWYGPFPGVTLSTETAKFLGKAYGSTVRRNNGNRIIIGHEIRPYSEEIKGAFIEGVRSTGCSVIDAGPSLTPFIYFAVAYYNLDGGVSVTGSHNVYFFNGFKLMRKNVYPIFGDELQGWQKMLENEDFIKDTLGSLVNKDIFSDYSQYLTSHIHIQRPLKIVTDCGNGTPGIFAPNLFRSLGCEVQEIFSEPDANFPNHLPDPEDPFMMRYLSEKVVSTQADIGIAFDADGDRFGSVAETGNYIESDKIIALLAKDILKRNPGKTVAYDVKCSQSVDEIIKHAGGVPLMHRTGHAPIKQTLRDNDQVIFAGELSGHMYFVEDYFKIDDGIYAAAKTLELFSQSEVPYSQLFSFIPKSIRTPEIKLPSDDSTKNLVVQSVNDYFSSQYRTVTIDGARIQFSPTSWGLVRASNTAPYLTIRFEADSVQELLRIKNLLADQLEIHQSVLDTLDRKNVTSHTGKLGWV